MNLITTVKTHFILHSTMQYVENQYRFDIDPLYTIHGGIYAIVDELDRVQKIGRGDGPHGLGARVKDYGRNNKRRLGKDATVERWRRVMLDELRSVELFFYYFVTPTRIIEDSVLNETIELSSASTYEKLFIIRAKEEGHPLLLGDR